MICGGECGAFNPLIIECLLDISDDLERELQTNTSGIKSKMGISLQEKECNLSECIHIPIIVMTANAFEEDKKNAYKAGMNGHIAKPINVNELISTLSEVLGREKSQV